MRPINNQAAFFARFFFARARFHFASAFKSGSS
jgi:hypothetical protein